MMTQVQKRFLAHFVKMKLVLLPLTLLILLILLILLTLLTLLIPLILLTPLIFEKVMKRVLMTAQACYNEKAQVLPTFYRRSNNCTSNSTDVFSQTIA